MKVVFFTVLLGYFLVCSFYIYLWVREPVGVVMPTSAQDFSQQVYWYELEGAPAPWADEAHLKELYAAAVARESADAMTAARSAGGSSGRKRTRESGVKADVAITPHDAFNEVMESLHCEGATLDEVVQAAKMVLEDEEGDASALSVVVTLCARRGIVCERFANEELKERKQTIRSTDLSVGTEAIFIFDSEKPIFCCAYPKENRVRQSGLSLELIVPIADPAAFRRRVARITRIAAKECVVLLVRRPEDVPPGARLAPLPPLEDRAAMVQRYAPGGNPFQAIPLAGRTARGQKRRSKSVKHPWYHRIIGQRATDELRKASYVQSQLETVRNTLTQGDDDY
jgi:hypothetical protein